MLKFILLNIIFLLFTPLYAYNQESLYRDNTASYVNKITKSIVKQFLNSNNASKIQNGTILIVPMVDIHDLKTMLPITKRIDENVMYEMSDNAFHVIDISAMKIMGTKEIVSEYLYISTFTNYKYEMVINARIVNKQTKVICASAQVVVPRKVLKDVEKLYNKDMWFSDVRNK